MRKAVATLVLLTASVAALAENAPQQKLNATLANLQKSKEAQAALDRKHADIVRELEKLQRRATALAEKLQQSERRVTNEEQALSAVSTRLTTRQKEFEARKADYANTVISLLRLRRLPMTAVFSSTPEDFEALMLTASVLEKTNAAIAAKANALRRDMGELKSLRGETATRRTRTSAETLALLKEQSELEAALRTRQALQASLAVDRARAEAEVAKLSRESESLQQLIGKLDAQPREKPPAKAPAATTKGGLSMPVAGEIIHRFGEEKNGADTYRGMVIRGRAGATVVAPNDGQVVFTGPFRDYGNMLLIKHSGGYISLIAGVGKLTASLNQHVNKGEPIAVMGQQKNPEAYVELRDSSAKPIDPANWFANVTATMSRR